MPELIPQQEAIHLADLARWIMTEMELLTVLQFAGFLPDQARAVMVYGAN